MPRYLSTRTLFFVTLVVYINSQVFSSADTIWSLYVSMSLLKEGDTDLDEYSGLIPPDDYRVEQVEIHTYSVFPVGASLLATPFVYIAEIMYLPADNVPFSEYLSQHAPDEVVFRVEKTIASMIMSITVAVMFLIASKFTHPLRAFIVASIFAFGTSAWSVGSRGLWQHGPSMLALSITLYLIVLSKEKPRLLPLAAFPLGFAYLIRPTNIIPILILSVYVLLAHRRLAGQYLICLALTVLPFLLHNFSIYGMPLAPYYSPGRLGIQASMLEALAGNLISPSRGLFTFSPILLFSVYEIARKTEATSWQLLRRCLMIILILHWISISMFGHWYGGWSIGPRLWSDMLPLFAYFLIPAADRFVNLAHKLNPWTGIFWVLALVSAFIHFRCATTWAPFEWNYSPVNIDKSQHRLWDWTDIQFLRGLCPEPDDQAPRCWFVGGSEKQTDDFGRLFFGTGEVNESLMKPGLDPLHSPPRLILSHSAMNGLPSPEDRKTPHRGLISPWALQPHTACLACNAYP